MGSNTICDFFRRFKLFFSLLLPLGLFFFQAQPLQAATYYVSDTNTADGYPAGSDSNPGSITQPFLTLFKATGVMVAGDTVYVMPGTYSEGLNNRFASGTDWSTPTRFLAYDANNRPIMRPPAGTDRVLNFATSSGGVGRHHIIFDGFVFDAVNVNYDAVKITYSGSDQTKSANHIRIMNSEIMNAPENGVLITGENASYNEFINVKIHDNGQTQYEHGLYISAGNNTLDHCEIYNNTGYGVHFYNEHAWTNDGNVLKNSIVHDNADYGYTGAGVIAGSGANDAIYNNIFYNNNSAISVNYGATNVKIYNNTIFNNNKNEGLPKPTNDGNVFVQGNIVIGNGTGTPGVVPNTIDIANNLIVGSIRSGIYISSSVSNVNIRNNLFYNNGDNITDNPGTATTSNNLFNQNPLFVNDSNHNFTLSTGSPAINSGITLSETSTDLTGLSRPQGSAYDLGVYETIQSPTSTPTPTPTATNTPPPTPTATPTPSCTDTQAPVPPVISELSCDGVTHQVTLTWSATTDQGCAGLAAQPYTSELSLQTDYSTTVSGWNTAWVDTTTQTLTDGSFTPSTTLYARVQARDSLNNISTWTTQSVMCSSPSPSPTLSPTPTDTPTPTPTTSLTPTPSLSPSVSPTVSPSSEPSISPTPLPPNNTTTETVQSSFAEPKPPGCASPDPGLKTPWVYAAEAVSDSSIRLYFTDADEPLTQYVLAFGLHSNDYLWGAQDIGGKGQRIYQVNYLFPNTTYYFRVRAQNGCAPGNWSNEIQMKTPKKNARLFAAFSFFAQE